MITSINQEFWLFGGLEHAGNVTMQKEKTSAYQPGKGYEAILKQASSFYRRE